MLNAALYYISNNGCPATTQTFNSMIAKNAQSQASAIQRDGLAIQSRDPRRDAVILENKLVQPILPPPSE
jgi:hypothetical protein